MDTRADIKKPIKLLKTPKVNVVPDAQKTSSEKRSGAEVSGAGMDKQVKANVPYWKKWLPWGFAIAVVAALVWLLTFTDSRALNVNQARITIATVETGIFEDFIPLRGRVTPAKTVFLDAIEGGRVDAIFAEDGAVLTQGDLIVRLSNTSLQLDVTRNEALVAEQLNNMRSIELQLEQNRLQHKRNLLDINYQIKLLTRRLAHEQGLLASNAIAQNTVDDTRDTLDWYKGSLAVTLESQATDNRMQQQQLVFLSTTSQQLEQNLEISRQNLENMNVRAPVTGKLSGFDVEVGQSIGRGGRLGQIDTPNDYKVTAFVDEFYLTRVDLEQQAQFTLNGIEYPLSIKKIYPQVNNGQFEVDFHFEKDAHSEVQQPDNIRRGQTLQLKLTLGDASEARLLPNAAFYQNTGGNWIFVVNEDGTEAIRRDIKIGRRNNNVIEVLEGLAPGEQVIVSSYGEYEQVERLKL